MVVGGYYDPMNEWTPNSFRKEVEQYNPTTNTWTTLAPMPVARGDMVWGGWCWVIYGGRL